MESADSFKLAEARRVGADSEVSLNDGVVFAVLPEGGRNPASNERARGAGGFSGAGSDGGADGVVCGGGAGAGFFSAFFELARGLFEG